MRTNSASPEWIDFWSAQRVLNCAASRLVWAKPDPDHLAEEIESEVNVLRQFAALRITLR
jgi:hypothetical protein